MRIMTFVVTALLASISLADSGKLIVHEWGTFLSVLGSLGLDTGQFSAPVGLAIDPTSAATRLLVADSLNHRVETFIDSNGPDTTLQTFPASSTKLATADFTFTANDVNATFECKLDGAVTWDATCNGSATGSASYSGLTEGTHQPAANSITTRGWISAAAKG
jgi:hypothetical protein